jgi:nitroreductase
MEVMQAIRDRRSVRRFKTDPVTDEMLGIVLEAGHWAPSWANTQCCSLIVVHSPDIRKELAGALISHRPGGVNPATEAVKIAPVVLVACARRDLAGIHADEKGVRVPDTDKGEWWFMFDAALVMQKMARAAHALGLGTVHVGLLDAKKAGQVLEVPDNMSVVSLMPLGFPDHTPILPPRRPMSQFVSYEKYGS